MAKLTATEFKALKDDTARYSAYDNAANTSDEARSAQANAIAENESYFAPLTLDKEGNPVKDEKGNYVGGKLAVANRIHADAIAKLNTEHATALQEAADKAAGELAVVKQDAANQLAAAKAVSDQALADAQAKVAADLAAKDAELATLKAANDDLTTTIQKVFPTVEAGKAELAKVRKAELTAQIVAKDAEKQALVAELGKMDVEVGATL